jgi:hypothetical protein
MWRVENDLFPDAADNIQHLFCQCVKSWMKRRLRYWKPTSLAGIRRGGSKLNLSAIEGYLSGKDLATQNVERMTVLATGAAEAWSPKDLLPLPRDGEGRTLHQILARRETKPYLLTTTLQN